MDQSAQLQPGVVQEQQNKLKQQQYEVDQRDKSIAASQAAYDPSTKTWDPDKFGREAAKSGVHPQTIATMQAALLKAATDKATLSKDQLANEEEEHKQKFEHIESLRGLLDPDAPNNMIQGESVNNAYQQIMMDEAHKKGPQAIANWPTTIRTKDQIDQIESQMGMEKYVRDKAEQLAKTKHEAMGTPEQAELGAYLQNNPNSDAWGFAKAKAALAPTVNYNLQARGVPAGGAATAASQGETSPGKLQDAIPANIKPTVMAVVEGRMTAPTGFALKSPYWQNVMNQVYAIDPQFNEQRAQLRKAYTLGPQSKEINAINTVIDHVGVMNDAVDALNSSDVKALNAIANKFGVETGSSAPAVFKTIVHRVGPELSKAYLGSGGSAGERGADENDFNVNLAPGILKDNANVTLHLLNSKIGALRNQWDENAAPGVQSFDDRFLTKNAKAAIAKTSGGSGGKIRARDPQGVLHEAAAGTALPAGWKIE